MSSNSATVGEMQQHFTTWKALSLFFHVVVFHVTLAQDLVNPISTPIITGELDVHVAPFVQIPKVNNETAEILCIVQNRGNLYVGTQSQIFEVNRARSVRLWFDVDRALSAIGSPLAFRKSQGGLRSVAFPKNFKKTGYFYTSQVVHRAMNPDGHHFLPFVHLRNDTVNAESMVSEWRYNRTTKTISPTSHREVFRVSLRRFTHPIKQIAFRRSKLFVAHGDSADQTAIFGGGQNPDGLGKIIAIRPRKRSGVGITPYTIPGSNPFVRRRKNPALGNRQEMIKEVWALGFRNPHNLCFGRKGTLFVVDIGRGNIEEVNIVKKGRNYGWPKREGTFVHFQNDSGGEIIKGIGPLPPNDENEENRVFEYPAAQFGHEAKPGSRFVGQAIAGGCPVENGSPVSGNYFFADFPRSGRLFYSHLKELLHAKTNGSPDELTQARVREANIFFDHDNNQTTPAIRVQTLKDIILMEMDSGLVSKLTPKQLEATRTDVRFGMGPKGELYWSSKTNGKVYVISSSLVDGPGGPVRR